MADILAGIAPQKDTYANWVILNPTLGKTSGGNDYSQMIFATGSPVGDILIWGMAQSFTTAYGLGQYAIQGKERSILSKSADYTVTDSDPDIIEVTTGATNRTITLPTLADNTGRKIKVIKIDSGIGKVIIDGEGTEIIDGNLTIELYQQYDNSTIICGVSFWNTESYNLLPYTTGAINSTLWNNQQFNVNHGFNTHLENLVIKFYLSDDGTDGSWFEVQNTTRADINAITADTAEGTTVYETDVDNIYIQTGADGVRYINNSSGGLSIFNDPDDEYYKVVITKLYP